MRFAYAILLIISTASPAFAPTEYDHASEWEVSFWAKLNVL
jgi:hypothetical protein